MITKKLKTSKKSTKPKLPIAKLKKLADAEFSKYIRQRDSVNGVAQCITCGVSKPIAQMQNGHFVSRRVSLLRYDEENCNAQCVGCNMFKHGDLFTYAQNLDLKYGDGTAKKLHYQRFTTHKFTSGELLAIIEECKERIKEYAL